MVVAMIVACEVGFWVLLALGLFARYGLRRRRLGTALLYSTPVLEVILLAVAVVDLRGGATAGTRHAIAALYIGVSVVFGHTMVKWADSHIGYHFLGGPPPARPPAGGVPRVRYEAGMFARTLAAVAITAGLLGLLMLVAGDTSRTRALSGFFATLGVVTVVSLVISVWEAVERFRRPPDQVKPPPRRLSDRRNALRGRNR